MHDRDRFHREIEDLLRAAPNQPLALVAIGDFAASNGDAMLTERLEQKARSLNLNADPLKLLTIEADLVAGKYRRGLDRVKFLYSTHPDLAKSHAPLLLSFQTIAHFGLGEPEFSDLTLAKFLNQAPPRAPHLLKIAESLIAVSAVEPAIKVLTAAINADPLNQPALARLVSIEL